MATKKQMQELEDKYSAMHTHAKELLQDKHELQDKLNGKADEMQKLKLELSKACHYRGHAENERNKLATRLKRVESYLVDLAMDGKLSGDDY